VTALPALVPDPFTGRVQITGTLVHRCPHVDEVDRGTVRIAWTCTGRTLELHSLAAWLQQFTDEPVSHEELTGRIRDELAALTGITDVEVSSDWRTAGLAVAVTA
jgi:NADPH-dependent 7-cyano-7-deazaguanine reductase QueF